MKKGAFLAILLLTTAAVLPFVIFRAKATLSAGPNQQVYVGTTTSLNGTTTDNATLITQVMWDFGDNSTAVNGTSSSLLNTTHVYNATGLYNATLTVSFGGALNKTDFATAQVTVVQNLPPVADAGPNQFVEQTSVEGANATLDGAASSDPYNDALTYSWIWASGSATGVTSAALFQPGNTTVTLTVSDGQLFSTDTVIIIVRDTTPPFVDAGQNVTVEAGSQITLNGTAVDTVATRFNFTWSENGNVLQTETNATNTNLSYTAKKAGIHQLTLNAADESGNTNSDNVTVTVVDTIPPAITAVIEPNSLWPPNHKYVEVKVSVAAEDLGDPKPLIALISMSSNEADNAKGDGNTVNDFVKIDDFTFNMRAERSGAGSGRVYTLAYKATDASGNYATAFVTVEVPHAQ